MNGKTEAVEKLRSLGLTVPRQIVVREVDVAVACQELENSAPGDFWYLRSTREHDGALRRRVVPSNRLSSTLSAAFAANPNLEILVQERIDVGLSGVLATIPGLSLIEYVRGALQSLLRDGATPARIALDPRGHVLATQLNPSDFWYRWKDDGLVHEGPTAANLLPRETLDSLLEASSVVERSSVVEWVQDQRGAVVFLDIKRLPQDFLSGATFVRSCFTGSGFATFDAPISGTLVNSVDSPANGVILLGKPLWRLIEPVLQRASAVILGEGAVLSHMAVYAAMERIPCIISRSAYAGLFSKQTVSSSSSELLNLVPAT